MKNNYFLYSLLLAAVALSAGICLAAEEDSGVIVYGNEAVQESTSQDSAAASEEDDVEGVEPKRKEVEIRGIRIGSSMISTAVTISEERVITNVEVEPEQGVSIFRVEENGDEYQVFDFDRSEQAVGRRLPAGAYRVYPNSRGQEIIEVSAIVYLGLPGGGGEE